MATGWVPAGSQLSITADPTELSTRPKTSVLIVEILEIIRFVEKPLIGRAVWIAAQLGHGNGAPCIRDAVFIHNGCVLCDRHSGMVPQLKAAALENKARSGAVNDGVVVRSTIDVLKEICYCVRGAPVSRVTSMSPRVV